MAYATRAQMYQLALPASALTNVATADQDEALEGASDHVDTYLRGRYTVPLQDPTTAVVRATCILAGYDLISTRGHNPTFFDQTYADRVDRVERWLMAVSRGAANLDPTTDGSPDVHEGAPEVNSRGPVVSYSSTIETNTPRGW